MLPIRSVGRRPIPTIVDIRMLVIQTRAETEGCLMSDLPRTLTAVSAVLALIGAWCIGFSVIDKFTGREYGDVGFGGNVNRTPEYDSWAKKNDRRTYWGLIIITVGGVLQIATLYIPPQRSAGQTAESNPATQPDRPAPR